ncbi:hypothetical protein GCM10007301_14320 [Azorhizobium oxalatiphilum]|uniref:Uncharacterized protein n=1 Tax=Azorhizobium oxalatiphilum TaxID=980631 RepID=A0A917F8N2_9HYPH|nr:hypothetical protein [Azorhizobium oxalatiphilum]GGF55801.1 hypothetical protein GCM10007301_14320 [Azorhizobium oxalatiphilum]
MRPQQGAERLRITEFRTGSAVGARMRAAVLVLGAALSLAGCAGDSPMAFLDPKVPDVPKVEPANYITIGAPEVKRRPTLSPADQTKLQQQLEGLSKDNGKSVEQAIEKGV